MVFSDPNGGVLLGHAPVDSALFSLLAHVAFADQQIDDSEFAVLRRLFPEAELGEVLVRIADEADRPMDLSALLVAIPIPTDRYRLVELAKLMARCDGVFHDDERAFLDRLRDAIAGR